MSKRHRVKLKWLLPRVPLGCREEELQIGVPPTSKAAFEARIALLIPYLIHPSAIQ